jgi:hypothetical protein
VNKPKSLTKNEEVVIPADSVRLYGILGLPPHAKGVVVFAHGSGSGRFSPPVYPLGNTLPIFQGVDVRICNLACVISDKGTPWSLMLKVFQFRSDARNVETLKIAGIDAVSLANNHALDLRHLPDVMKRRGVLRF